MRGDGGEGKNQFSRHRRHFTTTAAAAPMSVVVIVLCFSLSLFATGLLNRTAVHEAEIISAAIRVPPSAATSEHDIAET